MQHIVNASQLHALARDMFRIADIRSLPPVTLDISTMPPGKNLQGSDLINRLKSECGCFAGGLLMGLSVLLVAGYLLSDPSRAQQYAVGDWLQLAAVVAGAALFGKVLAIAWARARIVLEIRRMLASIDRK